MARNAPGGATGSSTDSDKDSSVDCPDCGKEYQTTTGLRYHLRSDNTDCSGLECVECGEDCYHTQESLARHMARSHNGGMSYTDSRVSNEEWFRQKYVEEGLNTTEISELVGLSKPTVSEWKRKHGIESKNEYKSRGSGKDNPTWTNNTVKTDCEYCDTEIEIRKRRVEVANNNFCNPDCLSNYVSENRVGEDHPLYKGGEHYYGSEWRKDIRNKVRERDNYRCQSCGMTEEEQGRQMDVHHLRPVNEFDDISEAHEIDNLVCYCRSCHQQWEGIPLRPDNR